MVYSNTTDKNGLLQHVEFLTGSTDGYISGNTTRKAQATALLNRYYYRAVTSILDAQDDWDFDDRNFTDYPVATTPLVAGQRDYSFPVSLKILKIKRVDVTWDGTNYYRCSLTDSGAVELGLGNDTNTDSRYSLTTPGYDLLGNAVWLYPLATADQVSAGAKLRIEFLREIDEFTTSDTTQEPGIDEPFHPYISIGAAFEWAMANDLNNKTQTLAAMLADYEARLKAYYGRKNQDEQPKAVAQYVDYE